MSITNESRHAHPEHAAAAADAAELGESPATTARADFAILAGNPRSGSHALALELERRGVIAVPTEPRFATLFACHPRLAGDLGRPENRRRLLHCIFAFLWLWERRNRTPEQLRAVLPHSLLSLAPHAESIAAGTRSYAGVLKALHEHFARRHGATMSLDKVTFLRDAPIARLAARVPDLKLVHIVRDGRDVSLSWCRVWFGVSSIDEAALRWRRRVLELRAWGESHPDAYMEVRYEDFVADPGATCRAVMEFLGVDAEREPSRRRASGNPAADTQGQRPSKEAELASRQGHEKLAEDLDASRAGRWSQEMSAAERDRFERVAGDALAAFAYPLATGASSAATRNDSRAFARIAAGLGSAARTTFWKQCAVARLPAMLLLGERLGLPIARLLHERAVRFVQAHGSE